jgi:hypothetical protein
MNGAPGAFFIYLTILAKKLFQVKGKTFPDQDEIFYFMGLSTNAKNPRLLPITPMCKVKFLRCRGIRLESKPVSYSWFPIQVGPQVNKSGVFNRADRLANVVAG